MGLLFGILAHKPQGSVDVDERQGQPHRAFACNGQSGRFYVLWGLWLVAARLFLRAKSHVEAEVRVK